MSRDSHQTRASASRAVKYRRRTRSGWMPLYLKHRCHPVMRRRARAERKRFYIELSVTVNIDSSSSSAYSILTPAGPRASIR